MKDGDPTETLSDVVCIRATEKALLCLIDTEEVWIPKSQIVADESEVSDDSDNSTGKLVVSQWIAREKNLV